MIRVQKGNMQLFEMQHVPIHLLNLYNSSSTNHLAINLFTYELLDKSDRRALIRWRSWREIRIHPFNNQ